MWRLLLILSILPVAAALAARWWFGLRILSSIGKEICRCDLGRWLPAPGDEAVIHKSEETASDFGWQLRLTALAAWRESDLKAAAAREGSRRFGMAVPPLSGVVAALGVFSGRIPVVGVFAILLAATALASVFSLLSLGPELQAIAKAARKLGESNSFPKSADEEAVVQCAIAHAWDQAVPPILRGLQR